MTNEALDRAILCWMLKLSVRYLNFSDEFEELDFLENLNNFPFIDAFCVNNFFGAIFRMGTAS